MCHHLYKNNRQVKKQGKKTEGMKIGKYYRIIEKSLRKVKNVKNAEKVKKKEGIY